MLCDVYVVTWVDMWSVCIYTYILGIVFMQSQRDTWKSSKYPWIWISFAWNHWGYYLCLRIRLLRVFSRFHVTSPDSKSWHHWGMCPAVRTEDLMSMGFLIGGPWFVGGMWYRGKILSVEYNSSQLFVTKRPLRKRPLTLWLGKKGFWVCVFPVYMVDVDPPTPTSWITLARPRREHVTVHMCNNEVITRLDIIEIIIISSWFLSYHLVM